MKKRPATIEVERIDIDKENPRIKAALENPSIADDSYDELRLQLEHAMSAGGGSRGWRRLRSSIKAAGRAVQRITVVEKNGRYVCIERKHSGRNLQGPRWERGARGLETH